MPERRNMYAGKISYDGLWNQLSKRGMKKQDLRGEEFCLSPTIVTRLAKNENVSVETIMYLCEKLDCQPGDILSYVST